MSVSVLTSIAIQTWVFVCVSVCVCVFLHVCMSASHECAMWRRLKEARRRVSGVAPSFLPLFSHRSRPMMDDGEWEVSSPGLPTAAGCRQRTGHLLSIAGAGGGLRFWACVLTALAVRWGYRDSQASRQGGLQRNEQPSETDKWNRGNNVYFN